MAKRSNKAIFVHGFAKALEEQWQVDVRLKARDSGDGVAVFAHKLVLASRSQVLKNILEQDEFKAPSQPVEAATPMERITKRPKKQIRKNPKKFCCRGHYVMLKRSCETVTFSELKHEELEALVKFIYSDGSCLSAKAKEIPHLRDLCRNEIVTSLNPSNALEVLELSLIPLDNTLRRATLTYIIENLKTIANSPEFELFANKKTDLTLEIIRAYVARGNSVKNSNRRIPLSSVNNRFLNSVHKTQL